MCPRRAHDAAETCRVVGSVFALSHLGFLQVHPFKEANRSLLYPAILSLMHHQKPCCICYAAAGLLPRDFHIPREPQDSAAQVQA